MKRALRERAEAEPFAKTLELIEAAEGRAFTAAVLHVRLSGEVALDMPFGVLMPGGPRVQPDTRFDLASITKVFAGTALLALFDSRRILRAMICNSQ